MKKLFLFVFLIFLFLVFLIAEAKGRKIRGKDIDIFDLSEVDRPLISTAKAPYDWEISTPEEQRMDSTLVENALREAEKIPYLYSLLMVKNGYLVAEKYFQGKGPADAQHIRWCNAVLSALVGIALKENYLQSVDQKMLDFFPEYIDESIDPDKYNITIEHLLTMRAGFNFEERSETAWGNWMSSSDWLQFAIGYGLREPPGERFFFSSIHTHILSGLLTKATGMSTLEFAQRYLFGPLGMSIADWDQDPQGIYLGGWGMYFTPRDLARFGWLYANNGAVEGKQIFHPGWIDQSLQPYTRVGPGWFDSYVRQYWNLAWGYGYHWVFTTLDDYLIFFQLGYGGQFLLVIPELKMVVVITVDENGTWSDFEKHFDELFPFVVNYLMKTVWEEHEPPPYPPENINGVKIINRSLSQFEAIDRLTWDPNPKNAGVNITTCRIYMIEEGVKVYLDEVDAASGEYIHREHMFESTPPPFVYGVSMLTAEGKESTAAIVTPRQTDENRD
ncbi:MAG: serine hydrolase [Candidatus Aminicenantes bacterium]|nr:MAG: serine hydrolase [Candidatus Aminicenantes bacterium]